jgi:hypothetical protein
MKPSELRDFRREDFLSSAKEVLEKNGIVTNEHQFTPFRDTITAHVDEIERELRIRGYKGGKLEAGHTDHRWARTIYYIFDSAKLSADAARAQAIAWVDRNKVHFD